MYSRNFRPGENRTEGNVPVQFFGDSFSADAFAKNESSKNYSAESYKKAEENTDNIKEESKQDTESAEVAARHMSITEETEEKTGKAIGFDDLLLVGLILLFLMNSEKKDDIILPVILAAVLLF